jgi:allophanate hydrolase
LLVGKTNLDPFACGLSGARSPFGEVPNAFNPAMVSGGSSSGSAYAVATGAVDFALGTDTAGSGRVPAGLNNIVGFKPTRGRISAHGVVPAVQSADAVSVLARTVPMAWRVLQSAAGFDPLDPFSRGHRDVAWRTRPYPAAPQVGIPRELEFFGDDLAREAFDQATQRLVRMGARLVLIDYQPLAEAAELLYGSALVAERYLAIREFFDGHELDIVEPVRSIIGASRRFSANDVLAAQLQLRRLAARIRPMWDGIDFMMVPTTPTHVDCRNPSPRRPQATYHLDAV